MLHSVCTCSLGPAIRGREMHTCTKFVSCFFVQDSRLYSVLCSAVVGRATNMSSQWGGDTHIRVYGGAKNGEVTGGTVRL